MRSNQWTKHSRSMPLLGPRGTKGAVGDQCAGIHAKADGWWDGKDSGGNIASISTAENDHWWTQATTREYCEDATEHHILTADIHVP